MRQSRILHAIATPTAGTSASTTARRQARPYPHLHIHLIPRYAGDSADPRGGVRWVIPAKANYWDSGSGNGNP